MRYNALHVIVLLFMKQKEDKMNKERFKLEKEDVNCWTLIVYNKDGSINEDLTVNGMRYKDVYKYRNTLIQYGE